MALLEHEKETVPAMVGNSASFNNGDGGAQLVYQLVRVEEDGTVVPASEDEVIEMESYLEEGAAVQVSDAEGTQLDRTDEEAEVCEQEDSTRSMKVNTVGPQNLDSIEAERKKILAQLAFLDALLQKLKNEEQERASLETAEHLASHSKATRSQSISRQGTLTSTERWDSKSETHNMSSDFSDDFGQKQAAVVQQKFDGNQLKSRELESPSSTSKHNWTSTSSESLVMENSAQIHSTEDKKETSRDSDGDVYKRHSGLNKLSIRELHETFETTFGWQTSVKDKQWLKRRISLGLTGPVEVTSAADGLDESPRFPLTEGVRSHIKPRQVMEISTLDVVLPNSESLDHNKISHKMLSEEAASGCSPGPHQSAWVADRLTTWKESESPGKRDKVQYCREEAKRKRKPTKRYIEELTASEPRDITGGKANCTKEEKENSAFGSRMHLKELSTPGISKVKLKSGHRKRCYHPNKNSSKRLMSSSSEKAAKLVRKAISLRTSRVSENAALDEPPDGILPSALLDNASDLSTPSLSYEAEPIFNFSKFRSIKCDANALMEKARLPKKHHHPWTLREVMKLLEGVTHCGVGKWADIKKYSFSNYSFRSSTDLKDKWRNLVRASNTHFKMAAQGERHPRKHSASPVPGTVLIQVRELTKQPSPVNAISGMSRSGRSVSRKHCI